MIEISAFRTFFAICSTLEVSEKYSDKYNPIVTKGGIAVKEVVPATMESKQIKGLYFAGEILDLDALTAVHHNTLFFR